MSFVLILMTVLLFVGAKIGKKKPVDDYISKDGTLAVKGFFTLLIFFSHAKGYRPYSASPADLLMTKALAVMSQLIVVAFLFYSGYGIMLSVMKKKDYAESLPKKRILPLIIKFDVAIAMFLVCDMIIGEHYPVKQVLLSLIGWESVGNSSWYIFAILSMYVICFVVFIFVKNRHKLGALLVTFLTVGYIVGMMFAGKGCNWYDTVIVFPAGMWFAIYKEKFDLLTVSLYRHVALTIALTALFVASLYVSREYTVFLHVRSLLFAFTLVAITRRISPRNKILSFFGRHVFSIYILQRIPYLLLDHYFPEMHLYPFVIVGLSLTCIVGVLFDRFIMPELLFSSKDDLKKTA